MPDPQALSPEEQQKQLDEARRKLDAAKAQMDRQAAKGREAWLVRIKAREAEIARTREALAEAQAAAKELSERENDPLAAELAARLALAAETHGHAIRMKEREIACYQQCVALVENIGPVNTDPPPAMPTFPQPSHDLAYLEARSQFDASTLAYHMRRNKEGIDAILRASGNGGETAPDEQLEAARKARADALRELTRTNKDLMIMLGKLGGELVDARALLDWAQSSLQTLGQLPAGPRGQALADADWAKLNGAVQMVIGLPERAKPTPPFGSFFPPQEA